MQGHFNTGAIGSILEPSRRRKEVIGKATVFCQQIQLQSQRISYLISEMGNSFEGRQNLLAKNWSKVQGNKYRNIITEQLIDEHTIEYQNEEEMMHSSSLLLKRANFNHPNIIKLIYFQQDSIKPVCVNRLYRHRIFVEHQQVHLETIMKSQKESPTLEECLCCPIISGLAFLAQKYGNFLVKESMIFVSSQAGWQRKTDKHSAKVWINSKPSSNEPEIICNEQQMCQKIAIIFKRMFEHKLCQLYQIQQLHRFSNVQQLVKYIYQLHNLSPVKEIPKKRVLSNASFNGQPTTTPFKTLTTQQFSQESLHHRYTRTYSNHVKPDTEEIATNDKTRGETNKGSYTQLNNFLKKKELITPTVSSKNLLKDQSRDSIFYKPQNGSFKVNFSYQEDRTPKQNKSFQQVTAQRKIPVTPPQVKQYNPQFVQPFGNNIHFRENLVVTPIKIKENRREETHKKSVSAQQAIKIEEDDLKKVLEDIVKTQRELPFEELDQKKSQNFAGSSQKNKVITEQEEQEPEVAINPPPQLQFLKESDPFANLGKQRQAQYDNFVIEEEETPQQSKQTILHPSNPIISMSFETLQSKYAQDSNEAPSPGRFGFKQQPYHDFLPSFREQEKRYTSRDYNQSYGNNDNSYNKYLQKFEQIVKPHESIKANYYSKHDRGTLNKSNSHKFSQKAHKADSLNQPFNHQNDAESQGNMRFSDDNAFTQRESEFISSKGKQIKSGELESVYNESQYSEEEDRKAKIIERIENTEKIIRENRKKLEKIQLEKDLQREKEMIKKEMESLLKNNMMSDETNRIKEKVKHKKATFAELKAEASKILEDLNF